MKYELFTPNYDPPVKQIAEAIQDVDKSATEVADEVIKRILQTDAPGQVADMPKPLTEEEALALEQRISELLESINTTRDRINNIKQAVSSQIASRVKLSKLSLDISKRPSLQRAVKNIFGYKTDKITYQMYKAALDRKRSLEQQDIKKYSSGDW